MTGQGHNSYGIAAAELMQFIERVEALNDEKREVLDQIKEVMGEAKGRGYDTKVMRKVIAMRKRDATDLAEEAAITNMYCSALGMMPGIE